MLAARADLQRTVCPRDLQSDSVTLSLSSPRPRVSPVPQHAELARKGYPA